MKLLSSFLGAAALAACGVAAAAPALYEIDSTHTYPYFEADHMGISKWRGRFDKTSGKVMLDKEGGSGTVDITIDLASVDFGMEKLDEYARGDKLFDVAKYPRATYKGRLEGFRDGTPSELVGDLTLHGVTRPVTLKLNSFKCVEHPVLKRDLCGADAIGTFRRDEFCLDDGKAYGFSMDVTLRIQAEAVRAP